MIKKITILVLVLLIAAAAVAGVYIYTMPVPQEAVVVQTPVIAQATPDNSVPAGVVTAISKTSITVRKQNGIGATFGITASTTVLLSGAPDTPGVVKTLASVLVGTNVLIVKSEDGTTAKSVILLPLPPVK